MNAFASFVSAEPLPSPPADPVFREAMARFAGAVTIVGGQVDGRPYGILLSSMTALSVDPPRVLFCVRTEASCHDHLMVHDAVSLSVLGADDHAEAEAFRERALRFASDRWRHAPGRPPRLEGAQISLTGRISRRIGAGENTIFIVDIDRSEFRDGEPLLYFGRQFRALQPLD